jgi:hypothetical protein
MVMSTLLDGATDQGEANTYPSNPGQFAARWNSWKQYRSAWDTQHGNRPPVVSRIGNVVVITFADTTLQIVGGVATWSPITTES